MSLNLLSKNATTYLNSKKPFVLFSLPEQREVTGYFQKDTTRFHFEETMQDGFIFQPFQMGTDGYAIPVEHATVISESFEEWKPNKNIIPSKASIEAKEAYKQLVQDAKGLISAKKIHKIVTSRRVSYPLKNFDMQLLMESLFPMYEHAFRYIWYHPDTGLWCGATPELLLEADGECFKTMALAGTRNIHGDSKVIWEEKERDEQQLVVDDITSKLQSILSVIKISKTTNHTAGSLVHLRTDISGFVKKGKGSLFSIAHTLHPTPAVCGTPTKKSFGFITEKEGYDREFYTGYLGILGRQHQASSFFVNLRCMKIEGNNAHVYVGGGITKGSDPEMEWIETENKQQTMLRVLEPLL